MEITTIFWFWIAIAALFALAELMTVTFFGLWMAIAAMVPALVVLIAPALSLAEQLLIWGVASLLCAWVWVRWIRTQPEKYLAEPLVGQQGILASALVPGESGKLLLSKPVQGRQEWPCISDVALPRQARVTVVAMIGEGQVKVAVI